MRDDLIYILNNYKAVKEGNKSNQIELKKVISQKIVAAIKQIISDEHYVVKGSFGNGNMAAIPWIAVFDKSITTTAQQGYYLVYLFKADMSGVYLSLNQGWTHYKNTYKKSSIAREKAKQLSALVREDLNTVEARFCVPGSEKLDLANGKADLANGYESCHICGIYYELANMPEEEILRKDLLDMLIPYRELKGKIQKHGGSYETLNHAYLSDQRIQERNQDVERDSVLDKMVEESDTAIVLEKQVPPSTVRLPRCGPLESGIRTNYAAKQKRQAKVGLLGELAVLKLEQERLARLGSKKMPKHISVEEGDGTGYDILSYDDNGEEIYIEVKTTTKGGEEPFYLSLGELLCMQKYQEKYKIFRLYDFDYKENRMGKYYVISGDGLSDLELQPTNFLVGRGTPDPRMAEYIRALQTR